MKALDSSGESYFAFAPQLEALRTVISFIMTKHGSHHPILDPQSPKRYQLSFVDVKRAYFNAKVYRNDAHCFVELRPKDEDIVTAHALRRKAGSSEQQAFSLLDVAFTARACGIPAANASALDDELESFLGAFLENGNMPASAL